MVKFSTLCFSLSLPFLLATGHSQELGELIFQDDFERNESQEETEELTKGWGSNSKSRANGNKQVDLRDGAMYIYIHESADHGVSVTQPAEFKDGSVELKFKLEGPKDSLSLNFADLKCKEVHAGHLFVAKVDKGRVILEDLKTGKMKRETRDARRAKTLTEEQAKILKTKQKAFRHATTPGEWHHLLVTVVGDKISATIDGTLVGEFQSEGIAHPTKRLLRLSVPRQAIVDDVKIWKLN